KRGQSLPAVSIRWGKITHWKGTVPFFSRLLNALRHRISALVLAPQQPVGGFVADESFRGRIKLQRGIAQAVRDVPQVHQRRASVSDGDIGRGAAPRLDRLNEVLLVGSIARTAEHLVDELAGARLLFGAPENLPAAAVPAYVHQPFGAVDF